MTSALYDGYSVGGKPGYNQYSAAPLTTQARVDQLDLIASIGQRQASFRFELENGVTGQHLGQIYPLLDTVAAITHDVTRTIKRDLRIQVDATDLAAINTLTDRVLPFMVIGGRSWPLGRFMFTADNRVIRTGGDDGNLMLMDEMNLIDQEILAGFSSPYAADRAMRDLLVDLNLPAGIEIAPSAFPVPGGYRVGTRRGQILDTFSVQGDYESPWMDNNGVFRAIRTVDPSSTVPDLSFDDGYPVLADSISFTGDILTAPNRFVVIGNGVASSIEEIVGVYDLPPSAPHSIASRGFVIQQTTDLQVASEGQAMAAARNVGLRSSPIEQYDLNTPPDPRHDSYQVIIWRGQQWLELAWSMDCVEGGNMSHTLRRAYMP